MDAVIIVFGVYTFEIYILCSFLHVMFFQVSGRWYQIGYSSEHPDIPLVNVTHVDVQMEDNSLQLKLHKYIHYEGFIYIIAEWVAIR